MPACAPFPPKALKPAMEILAEIIEGEAPQTLDAYGPAGAKPRLDTNDLVKYCWV